MDYFSRKITGERVYLRLLTSEDAADYLNYLVRNKDFHEPFSPVRNHSYYTTANAIHIVNQRDRVISDQQYLFGIFDKATDSLAGKVTLSGIVRGAFQSCFLGYDIDRDLKDLGYTTEAIRLITSFALYSLHFHRLQASIMPRNLASQKVVEKAGFIREGYAENYLNINGHWEDHYIYSITLERYERLPMVFKRQASIE